MAELPSGTVTFLFTDIEGSTRLLKQFGDEYAGVLGEHQRLLREAFAAHGGHEIDTQGDAFFVVFRRAKDAVAAAVDGQRALIAHEWPQGTEVRVRMGVHSGEPVVGGERYTGMGVHRTARISAAGHGGQILVSDTTRGLVEDDLPAGVAVRELGQYRLKDVERPERLFQLDVDGLERSFPPLQAEQLRPPHPLRRRGVLAAAVAGVVAAAVAIPIFALGGGSGGEAIEAAAGNSVGLIDSESNRLVADVGVGTTPSQIAVGEGAVWVTNAADGTVDRLDPSTHTVRQTIPVGEAPDGIAVGAGSVWVANALDGTVSRIDPRSNEVTQRIAVGNGPSGVAFGEGVLWVVNRDDSTLSRINEDGKVKRTVTVGVGPVYVAVGGGAVWVTSAGDGKAVRIDPRSASVVETVSVGRGPGPIAAGPNGVWVGNTVDGTVSRVDPATSTVTATIPVGASPSGVAAGADGVWVASEQEGTISRIDPAKNAVVKTIRVGSSPTGLAIGPGGVYVAVRPAGGAHRGGTLTLVNQGWYDPGTIDPARSFSPLLELTNDGLTAFKRVGGRESTQIVPNLAVSLPEPTDGGKTWTFRVRKGIRYSTRGVVRPTDFRRALERVFELRSDGAFEYTSIVGGEQCSKRPRGCDLSRGIHADNRAGTVTFHLAAPDPDLPAKLALWFAAAVPSGTPSRESRTHALPATGPYRIAGYAPGRRMRLVRNPQFREWSKAAKPAGYPDEIVVRLDVPVAEQLRAVGRGEADVADLTNSGEPDVAALRARYGARLRSGAIGFVVYTYLNTRVPPFDDVRVRKALNLALDRDAIVRSAGGPDVASASCQMLPANYPGYRRYCPYERNLAEAKRLVAASGSRNAPVVVWTRTSYAKFYVHVANALRALGYRARLKVVEDDAYYDALQKAGTGNVQAGYVGWVTTYPTASSFLDGLLSYLAEPTGFRDDAVERRIREARRVQQTDPLGADELWARIDRMIVDLAPVVPMYNGRWIDFVSPRVGNLQYHPLSFTLLDQLWVR